MIDVPRGHTKIKLDDLGLEFLFCFGGFLICFYPNNIFYFIMETDCQDYWNVVSPAYLMDLRFNQPQIKNIFKNSQKLQKAKCEFSMFWLFVIYIIFTFYLHYLYNIYIVFVITSNLEINYMTGSIWLEDVHRLYASINTMPFYIRILSTHWFCYPRESPGTNSLGILRDDCISSSPIKSLIFSLILIFFNFFLFFILPPFLSRDMCHSLMQFNIYWNLFPCT